MARPAEKCGPTIFCPPNPFGTIHLLTCLSPVFQRRSHYCVRSSEYTISGGAIKLGAENVSAWSGIWSVRVPFRKLHKESGIRLKPNALRHSFSSYFLSQYGDIDALVLALGHRGSPAVLWEHYHRAVKKSAAKAFWAIRPMAAAQKIVAIAV
jgi:hypothetical protein